MTLFIYHTRVRLEHTDATGVLFFPQQLNMAMEAFEGFLQEKEYSLKHILSSQFLIPVVHVESTYLEPLRAGDSLDIHMYIQKIGTTSITLGYRFFDPDRQLEVGHVVIVHVVIQKATGTAVPIPDFLKRLFHLHSEG